MLFMSNVKTVGMRPQLLLTLSSSSFNTRRIMSNTTEVAFLSYAKKVFFSLNKVSQNTLWPNQAVMEEDLCFVSTLIVPKVINAGGQWRRPNPDNMTTINVVDEKSKTDPSISSSSSSWQSVSAPSASGWITDCLNSSLWNTSESPAPPFL